MKLILLFSFFVISMCATHALPADGWIQLTEKIPEEIRQEFKANFTRNSANGRIAYGRRAAEGQFPFMAWLHMLFHGGGGVVCGATLISRDFLISAAHCVPADRTRGINIWLGSVDRNRFPIFREATSFLNYPQWEAPGTAFGEHDINIIRMNAPADAMPANLPPRWTRDNDYVGVELVTAGWGGDENGDLSQFLMYTHTIGRDRTIGSPFIWTRGVDGSGVRGGDSGGPLLTQSNTFIGVTALMHAGDCGFVRVVNYLDWISTNTGIRT